MTERWITTHARTRMNHGDSPPRIHGKREGETAALCGKRVTYRYSPLRFSPDDDRACPQCAALVRKEKKS
jgi:hypothetical protein